MIGKTQKKLTIAWQWGTQNKTLGYKTVVRKKDIWKLSIIFGITWKLVLRHTTKDYIIMYIKIDYL